MNRHPFATAALAAALALGTFGAAAAAPVTVTLLRWPYT
jgi:hypothetical protein